LGDLAVISGAATVSEAYEWKYAVLDNGDKLSQSNPERYMPFIVSGNIRPFCSTWLYDNVQYIKTTYTRPVIDLSKKVISERRKNQIRSPKIVVSGMSKRPTCFWDAGKYAAGKSTVLVIPGRDISGEYLVGIINSDVMKQIYETLFGSLSLSGGYLRFGPPQMSELPVPNATKTQQNEISCLVKQISSLHELYGYPLRPERKVEFDALWIEMNRQIEILYGI
jgi:hypothetical protein